MNTKQRHTSLSLLIILVVVLAWFSPWWAGGKVLAPVDLLNDAMSPWWQQHQGTGHPKNHFVSDGADQYLVYRIIAAESYRKEGWLGWSSLTYGGTAQYANTMALYSDWTMQLHRWFDFWTAWHLGLLGQVWIAAAGMWFLLYGRKCGVVWSICGALLFAFNSQFITWIYHRWTLGSFCWVPWILTSIDRHESGSRRHGLLVPVFLSLSFLGGTLQHAALVVLVVIARYMEQAWRNTTIPGAAPRPASVFKCALSPRLLGRYSLWACLGFGLSAHMWLPCIAAFRESERVGLHIGLHGRATGIYPGGPLQPLLNLAAYPLQWFPSLLGRCDSLDVLKLFKSELFYVAFFGAVPVVVAFAAMVLKKTPALARILIVFGLLLPLSPLVRLLYQRLLVLFILGGIIAFAHFMRHADSAARKKLAGFMARLTVVMTVAWTLCDIVFIAKPAWLTALKVKAMAAAAGGSFGYFQSWFDERVNRFIHGLFIWNPEQFVPLALLIAGIIGLRLTASSAIVRQRAGQAMLATACVAEVLWFAAGWVVWADPKRHPLFAETPETRVLREKVGHEGRTTTLIHPSAHMALTPFIPNTLAAYGIASIHGYDSIVPDGMLRPFESADDARKLGNLAVSHLITWHGNPDVNDSWKKVWESPAMDLYWNPMAIPRYVGFTDSSQASNFHEGITYKASPLVETSGLENRRSIRIPQGITWVRVAENQAAGWQFRVSGNSEWNEVRRASDGCMEFQLPPSDTARTVEMRYEPPARRNGLTISMASIMIVIAGFAISSTNRFRTPLK